jgi:hypothetical protein
MYEATIRGSTGTVYGGRVSDPTGENRQVGGPVSEIF